MDNMEEIRKQKLRDYQKEYYAKNKEKVNARNCANYRKNIEKYRKYYQEYYQKNKLRKKEYYQLNKEKIKEYYQKNKIKLKNGGYINNDK